MSIDPAQEYALSDADWQASERERTLSRAQAKTGASYYAKAAGLIADELERLKPEHLHERAPKMIAVLRNAERYFESA